LSCCRSREPCDRHGTRKNRAPHSSSNGNHSPRSTQSHFLNSPGGRDGPARLISNNPQWDRSESGQVPSSRNSMHKKHRQDRRATLADIGDVQVFSPVSPTLVRPILGVMQAMSLRGSRSDSGGAEVYRCGSDQNLMWATRAGCSMHASFQVLAGREERCAGETGRPGSLNQHHPPRCGRWCKSLAGPAREAARMNAVHRCTSIDTGTTARSFSTMSGNAQSEIGNATACSHGDRFAAEGSHGTWRMYPFSRCRETLCWASKTDFPRHFLTLQAGLLSALGSPPMRRVRVPARH